MSLTLFRGILITLFVLGLLLNGFVHLISWQDWLQLYSQLMNNWWFLVIVALAFGATFVFQRRVHMY